ncbi:sulfurtransferase TusA family protein [Limibacillus halophilus]
MPESPTADMELDAKGLKCPLPVLKARKAMKGLSEGQTLRVLATDPSALQDFPAFCETTGHELLESREEGEGLFLFLLRKKD